MITADEYQKQALRTEKTPAFVSKDFVGSREKLRLERTIHALLGICTEAGEAQDMVKKHLIYERPYDETNVLEEAGDMLWYVALLLEANGFTMTQAMERNLAKLAARYPTGFTPEAANNRDLKVEREILEKKSCNRHADCQEADENYRKAHKQVFGGADHCHDECCSDCFGD